MNVDVPVWCSLQLEDFFVHVIGGDWGKDENHQEDGLVKVSCIRGSEFKNWKTNFGSTAVIRKIKASSLVNRKLEDGDILIEISGGGPEQPVGRTVLITEKVLKKLPYPSVCTNFLRLARSRDDINSSYLNYYLNQFYLSGEVTKYQGGSNNLRNLKFKEFSKIKVPLSPLAEQKVIADKLDTLLAQVESTKARLDRIPDILKRFRQSVLAAAVSGKLTEEWHAQQIELSKVTSFQNGYAFKSEWFESSGIYQVIKLGNIRDGHLELANSPAFVSELTANQFRKYSPKVGDTLLSMTGTRLKKDYGFGCLVKQETNLLINQRVGRIIPNLEHILPQYLNIFVRSDEFRDQFFEGETGGVNQGNVGSKHIHSILISLPSLKIQAEIVRHVDELFAMADYIESKANLALTRVNNLTQSILAKAFRGKLTAEWRAANPDLISGENSAEALLRKIKTELKETKITKRTRIGKKA